MRGAPIRFSTLVMPAAGNQWTPTFTVPTGIRGLGIFMEDAAAAGTLTIDVSYDGGTTFMTLQSGDADVNPARNKCTVLDTLPFTHLRIATDSATENALNFNLVGTEDVS